MLVNKGNSKISKFLNIFLKYKKWKFLKRQSSNNQEPNKTPELRMIVPDVAYNYKDFQEPLLALST